MSLVKAESRRLVKRRFTKWMTVIVVLILGVLAGSVAWNSVPTGPDQLAAAQAEAQQQADLWRAQAAADKAACEVAKAAGDTDQRWKGANCEDFRGPEAADVDPQWYLPYEFNFRNEFEILIVVFAGLLTLLGYIVGASYVGAEWNYGGMMNLLLWRPRRLRVLATKLAVALGGVLGIGVVIGGLFTTAMWLIAYYDGNVEKMTPGVWESFAISGARAFGFALAATAVGFGLASLGRHTATALGAAIGLVIVSELGLRIALGLTTIELPDRFLLSTYAIAWLVKRWEISDYSVCEWSVGQCEAKTMVMTWQDGSIVLGVGVVVVLLLAFWSMRRRDIT